MDCVCTSGTNTTHLYGLNPLTTAFVTCDSESEWSRFTNSTIQRRVATNPGDACNTEIIIPFWVYIAFAAIGLTCYTLGFLTGYLYNRCKRNDRSNSRTAKRDDSMNMYDYSADKYLSPINRLPPVPRGWQHRRNLSDGSYIEPTNRQPSVNHRTYKSTTEASTTESETYEIID